MSACRSYVEDGAYACADAIFFCNLYERLEIGVYISFVLSAGIIDENIYVSNIRQTVKVSDITLEMKI